MPGGGRWTPRMTVLGARATSAGFVEDEAMPHPAFSAVAGTTTAAVLDGTEHALVALVLRLFALVSELLPELETDEATLAAESVRPCTFHVFFMIRRAGIGTLGTRGSDAGVTASIFGMGGGAALADRRCVTSEYCGRAVDSSSAAGESGKQDQHNGVDQWQLIPCESASGCLHSRCARAIVESRPDASSSASTLR